MLTHRLDLLDDRRFLHHLLLLELCSFVSQDSCVWSCAVIQFFLARRLRLSGGNTRSDRPTILNVFVGKQFKRVLLQTRWFNGAPCTQRLRTQNFHTISLGFSEFLFIRSD